MMKTLVDYITENKTDDLNILYKFIKQHQGENDFAFANPVRKKQQLVFHFSGPDEVKDIMKNGFRRGTTLEHIKNTEEGLWCIVNRPPTMDLGSIQVLRVVDVINNAIENHMKVPLTSLVAWNGDFDGDTLSIYSLKEANIAKAFCDAFNPRRLINNKISGYKVYNSIFGVPKDLFMFIFPFVPEVSDSFSKGA